MNLLYPRIALRHLPLMLSLSVAGALLAGVYGILHDQVTYTLSQEYFTKFKAEQFAWADFDFPQRVFVAEIGFLATWWVGFVAGWLQARLAVPHVPRAAAVRRCFAGFGILFVFAVAGGLIGAWIGWLRMDDTNLGAWRDLQMAYDIEDLPHFVWAGFIHNTSYAGALVGLPVALTHVWLSRK
jgi:hypothetical protein